MCSGLTKNRLLLCLLCVTAFGLCVASWWNVSVYFCSLPKSSLCSCDKCLTEGVSWFRELISLAPEPFLSQINKTSEDAFNWWKRLQSERHNFTFYNATLENLFRIFPPVPDFVESSPERCKTCAVVGNSVNLKGSHYGPLIDLHDIVIRMNHGRTKGYEEDVGTRTTHHVMYPESSVQLDNATHLVLFPFKMKDLLWLLKTFDPGKNTQKIANKNLVLVLNPAFMKYVHKKWLANRGKYPSTGFLTLALSMQLCDEISNLFTHVFTPYINYQQMVSVFGFGADSDGNWSHYFEKLKNKYFRTGIHPGKLEYEVIQLLQRMQKISFYKGW